jgi:Secretion system C-terminal sorting domain
MKKITQLSFFVALAFSLFGVETSAQVYTPDWQDRIGPSNITAVYNYNFDQPQRRWVYRNIGPSYLPNWQFLYQDVIPAGAGTDTVVTSYGGQILVQILNMNNTPTGVQHIFNLSTLPPPDINVSDLMYGNFPNVSFRADIISGYGLGRGPGYRTKLYCIIWNADGSFQQIVEWNLPIGVVPFANFYLPPDQPGEYCFMWYVTDEDISLDSHFGEIVVWESDVLCFYVGDVSTSTNDVSFEKETTPSIRVFPNPTVDGNVTVVSQEATEYFVISASGQNVSSGKLTKGDNNLSDLSGLAPGTYILKTELGVTKLIKQ